LSHAKKPDKKHEPRKIKEIPSPAPTARAFEYGECKVMVGIEGGRWHLSIAHGTRYPTWDEIRDARYTFMPPDIQVGMLLPAPENYVNIHHNCFHLWQLIGPDPFLLSQAGREGVALIESLGRLSLSVTPPQPTHIVLAFRNWLVDVLIPAMRPVCDTGPVQQPAPVEQNEQEGEENSGQG
jgi:hypothetical protein